MKFSKKKFQILSANKQENVLLDFIKLIEINWQNELKREELLLEFRNCLIYSEKEEFSKMSNLLNGQIDLRRFLSITVPLEHNFGKNMKDSDFLILRKDGEKTEQMKFPLYLILDNLRSSFNVGSIFRVADCFGVTEIFLCGYTATPENTKVWKTAMGTDKIEKWKYFEKTREAIEFLMKQNIKIYALETTSNANPIYDTEFTKPCALILGNEALGISKDILRLTDEIVQIPIYGWKNSLNVGVTAGICCYEVCRQWKDY